MKYQIIKSSGIFLAAFRCVIGTRLAHPGPVLMRIHARTQTLFIARPVAMYHIVEFIPVRCTEIITFLFFIPLQVFIGYCQTKVLGLRYGLTVPDRSEEQ